VAAQQTRDHRLGDRRVALRRLDSYLAVLEDAQLRGESCVGVVLARQLRDVRSDITADTPLRDGMAAVLRAQEKVLRPARSAPPPAVESVPHGGLDEATARRLTERIRAAVGEICLLLLEAHERRAWIPLGYSSWQQYVQAEFALSRSRSYELLDHARITRAIEEASGLSAVADISTLTARQLRKRLPDVMARIQARLKGDSTADRRAVVLDVIRDEKRRITGAAGTTRPVSAASVTLDSGADSSAIAAPAVDPVRLRDSITYLARLHDARRVADQLPKGEGAEPEQVQAALHWLSEFRDACFRSSEERTRAASCS